MSNKISAPTLLLSLVLFFPSLIYSESLPARSGGRLPPYPDKYINVGGHSVEYDADLPENVAVELRNKKEDAVDDIVAVYEQIDWTDYAEAACLDKLLIQGCNEIIKDEIKSNKKARLRVKKIFEENPDTNARYILLAIILSSRIKDDDLVKSAVRFTTDSVREVRCEAIRILSEQKDPQYSGYLKNVLSSEKDKCLRVFAAEGLAAAGEQEGYNEISNMLNDTDTGVRISASRALGELKTEKAKTLAERAILNAAKTEKNPSVKASLAESLRQITGQPVNEIRTKYFNEKFE